MVIGLKFLHEPFPAELECFLVFGRLLLDDGIVLLKYLRHTLGHTLGHFEFGVFLLFI